MFFLPLEILMFFIFMKIVWITRVNGFYLQVVGH